MRSIRNVFRLNESTLPPGVTVDGKWPTGDMYAASRYDGPFPHHIKGMPFPPVARVAAGTLLYHGTGATEEWDVPRELTWFALHERAAKGYEAEVDPDANFRVLKFVLTRELEAVYFPPIMGWSYAERDDVENAIFWLEHIFKKKFGMLGHARVPDAFEAVARKHEGLYLAREDNGYPALMVSRPDQFVRIVR